MTVTVTPVNDAPIAVADTASHHRGHRGHLSRRDLLANDTDVDGDTLTVTAVTSGTSGTAVLNGDGTVTYTPDANFNGADAFTYTVTDGTTTDTGHRDGHRHRGQRRPGRGGRHPSRHRGHRGYAAPCSATTPTSTATRCRHRGDPAATSGTAVLNADGTVTFTPNANFNGAAASPTPSATAPRTDTGHGDGQRRPGQRHDSPSAPPTPDLDVASDTGLNTDNITSDNTPTFTGTAEAGSTVKIYSDGIEVGQAVATDGSYSITTSTLGDGLHHITATATDAANNISDLSDILDVTVDTTADIGGNLAVLVGDSLVNNTEKTAVAYTINGLDAGGTATVTFSDGVHSVIGAGGTANLSTLNDGPISVSISATDTAGNTASGTGASTTLDSSAAASINLNSITADNVISAAEAAGTVAVTGTVGGDVHNGDIVTLTINGTNYTGQPPVVPSASTSPAPPWSPTPTKRSPRA